MEDLKCGDKETRGRADGEMGGWGDREKTDAERRGKKRKNSYKIISLELHI
jgi:hypothetical protein